MNSLKQLNEKLGEARKRKTQAIEDRASKLTELEALMNADEPDQKKIDSKQKEIDGLKSDIQKENQLIENYTDQISDFSEVEQYEDKPFMFDAPSGPSSEEKEASQFRLVKALRETLDGGPQNLTGIEKEMQQQAIKDAKETGVKLEGNLHVPQIVMEARSKFSADITATGGAAGSEGGVTIQTDVMPLIDILRAKLPFVDSSATSRDGLGATFFTQLSGDLSFPRAVEGTDPATKTEVAAADEVSPTFEELTLTPTRLPGFIEVSRQLLLQSSTAIENWVRNHLMYKIAKPMHDTILTDILNASGTNAISHGTDGGAPTWAKVVEFETAVFDADAAMEDDPRLGYLTNAKVKGTLKTTVKETGQATYLWDSDNEVNNYPAVVSSLVPNDLTKGTGTGLSAMIFANWASLYIGQWGGISFLVNPYSRDTEGIIRINAWTFFDSGLRHAVAFAVAKDIITNS